jgi:hypothetical protein
MNSAEYSTKLNDAREKLLAALVTAQQWITNEKVPRRIPQSLDTTLDKSIREYNAQHKETSFDWLDSWKELLRNPPVDISPTAKPKVLRGFFEKLYAYDAFMESDATNLYVIGGDEYKNDDETEKALAETGYPKACVIHLDGLTIVKGPKETPKNPAKHIHYIMSGYEHLATDPNGKRMYVGRDTFREKYEHTNFKRIVHRTMAEKVAAYEAFFETDDRVLTVIGDDGGGEEMSAALALVKKRPAVWIPSDGPYSAPMKLPAIGYAEGEEEPPAKAIFYLTRDDGDIQDYIAEKNYTARTLHFAREDKK